jgi:hypothetical protein
MSNKKWIIPFALLSLLALTSPVQARLGYHGIYIGAQGGIGNTHYDNDLFNDDEIHEFGVAGRIYMGDQFNQHIALELGATQFSDAELDHDFGEVRTSQIELLVRLGAPIYCSPFRVDLKVGMADVFADIAPTDRGVAYGIKHEFTTEFRPVVGLSLSFYFYRHLGLDLSYMHTFGNPQSVSHLAPNNDLLTLGVSYLFTNP